MQGDFQLEPHQLLTILRFDNIPEIDTVLLDRPGEPYPDAGEAARGPVGAAIANAVFDATGIRARHLPMTPQSLSSPNTSPFGAPTVALLGPGRIGAQFEHLQGLRF